MALSDEDSEAELLRGRGVTAWTRPTLFFQVVLLGVLAVGAAVLVIELSSWRPIRLRADLTFSGSNTLDPKLESLLERLPDQATVETFLRQELSIYNRVWTESTTRLRELLQEMEVRYPDQLNVVHHDLNNLVETQDRLADLGLTRELSNFVVVRLGARKEVYRLYDDIAIVRHARFEPGSATEPELLEFRAAQVFAEGLAKVSLEGAPKVVFAIGHGEQDIFDNSATGLSQLRAALAKDGFEIEQWGADESALPEDCDVVAWVGPEQDLTEEQFEQLRAYVDRGGRLLVALGASLPGHVTEVLNAAGVAPLAGTVCLPVKSQVNGQLLEGHPSCAELNISGTGISIQHPVTRPLRENQRRVHASNSHGLSRYRPGTPKDGFVLELLSPGDQAWLDAPGPGGRLDYAFDQTRERGWHSREGGFVVAISSQFPPKSDAAEGSPETDENIEGAELLESRVLALGSGNFLSNRSFKYNRDFAMNSFNWLGDREFRISVAAIDPNANRVDLSRSRAGFWLGVVALGALPGLCVILGCVLAWRRKR